jgi:hypothetical protein
MMGRRTDLSVIRPPKVNREPYVWFRTKDLNFTGTNPLSFVRAPGGWFMAPSRAAGVAGGGHPAEPLRSEGVSVPLYIKLLRQRCREIRYVLAAPSAKGEMAAELSQ